MSQLSLPAFATLVLRTPADANRLASRWQVSLAPMPNNELMLNATTGTATISPGAARILGLRIGDLIEFEGIEPYAAMIESAGASKVMLRVPDKRFIRASITMHRFLL
jgi:hypothetical protein